MPTFKVNVKWGKEKYSDIELDTTEPTEVFKAQIFALTGVEPDRMKVMLKGSTLKESWDTFKGLKAGVTVLMMGSCTALPQAPVEKTVFVEDMTDQQLAKTMKVPAGLVNLGNTCYMNATIQCLRSLPELATSLSEYSPTGSIAASMQDNATSITSGLRSLMTELGSAGEAVTPLMFLQRMFTCFPRFAEKGEHGGFTQQDANECYVEFVRCLQQRLIKPGQTQSFIDKFMRIDYAQSMKCVESDTEPVKSLSDHVYQLSCYIDKDVKYLQTGLKSGLKEHITKRSDILERDAQWEKSSLISRLPAYLSIQFMRFYYKEKEAVNAKILKDIKFTLTLDVFDMCTPELQEKLTPVRDRMKEEDDRQAEATNQAKIKGEPLKTDKKTIKKPYSFDDDDGSNNSGFYELQAVLTHKGRSSSSGHYVAWTRKKGDDWLMFDDDDVTMVKSEDILKLSGGGDWHSAYVLLYAPKILEIEEKSETTSGSSQQKQEPMQE